MHKIVCALLVVALVLCGCASAAVNPLECPRSATQAAPGTYAVPAQRSTISMEEASERFDAQTSPGDRQKTSRTDSQGGAFTAGKPRPISNESPANISADSRIVLPSALYMVVGLTYRLQFADIVIGYDDNTEVVISGPENGAVSHSEHWEYTPEIERTFTLGIEIQDATGSIVETASRSVVTIRAPSGTGLRHLSIGDSITRAGGYVEFAVECVLGGKAVGTRTYDGGAVSTEGRGGWTLERYMTRVGESTGGDSPFLFPREVASGKYFGNTAFWREVTAVDEPVGYDYEGFQMIARGWRTSGQYLFDENGYPNSPSWGDVVIDPRLATEGQWRSYDGSMWQPMHSQYVELSFSKYIDQYGAAFSGGMPTSISIMLGTVDFLSSLSEASWAEYESHMASLIASIRAWNSEVPIILIGSPDGAPASMWSNQQVTGPEFDHRMTEHSQRLYAAFDTERARANRIYVISFLGVVSPDNMADYVHPKIPEGHNQMGPWLAGILAYLSSQGAI